MGDPFEASIEELAEQVNRQVRRVRETYGQLGAIESTMISDDGMISVTVGPQGQVRGIELNPRVYRRLSPSELSGALIREFERAAADVAEQRRRLMEPLMPEGLPYAEVFGADATLEAFLPGPVDPAA